MLFFGKKRLLSKKEQLEAKIRSESVRAKERSDFNRLRNKVREREETLRKLKSAGKGKSKFAGFLKSAGKKAFVSLQEYNKKQEKKKTARVKPSVSKSTVIKVNGKTIIIKSNKRKKKVEPVQKKTPDFGDVFNPF